MQKLEKPAKHSTLPESISRHPWDGLYYSVLNKGGGPLQGDFFYVAGTMHDVSIKGYAMQGCHYIITIL